MIDTLEIVPDNSFLVTSIQSSIIPSLTLPRIKQVGCKGFFIFYILFYFSSLFANVYNATIVCYGWRARHRRRLSDVMKNTHVPTLF